MKRGTYRAVFSTLFDDPDYQRLPTRARLVLVTARQCKDAGPAAIFRYYPEILAHQTGSTVSQVKEALEALAAPGWVIYDDTVLWVRNGLRYDPSMSLANGKHRKAISKHLISLPKSPVILKFCDYYEIAYPFDTHSIPIAIPVHVTDTDTETDTETETTTSSSARGAPEAVAEEVSTPEQKHARARLGWGTPEALVDLYHDLTPPGHPRVTLPLSGKRVAKAKTYLKQWPDRDFWVKVFGMVAQSSLLQGKVQNQGHGHFKADFDWFQQTGSKDGIENCLKAFEGKYLDKTSAGPSTESPLTWGCAACGKSHSTGRELKGVCQKAEEEAAAAALRATRSNIIPITDHRKESA